MLQGLNGSVGVLVLVVLAMDGDIDANGNISYLLLAPDINYFNLNPVTGEIRISSIGLDFEVINSKGNPLVFTLIAQDGGECQYYFKEHKQHETLEDVPPIFFLLSGNRHDHGMLYFIYNSYNLPHPFIFHPCTYIKVFYTRLYNIGDEVNIHMHFASVI